MIEFHVAGIFYGLYGFAYFCLECVSVYSVKAYDNRGYGDACFKDGVIQLRIVAEIEACGG